MHELYLYADFVMDVCAFVCACVRVRMHACVSAWEDLNIMKLIQSIWDLYILMKAILLFHADDEPD